jgi:hypothetical protein
LKSKFFSRRYGSVRAPISSTEDKVELILLGVALISWAEHLQEMLDVSKKIDILHLDFLDGNNFTFIM